MACIVHPPIDAPGPEDDFAVWLERVRQTVAAELA
jgi:hypothetical protein